MSIYYQNTRGLRSKTKQFYINTLNTDYAVICLTETWLNDSVSSNELFDDRFFVHRQDRNLKKSNKTDGGGVLIALSKTKFKSFKSQNSWNVPTVEMACVSAQLHNNKRFNIICIYLEPKFSLTKLELLLEKLQLLVFDNPNDGFLICGDWNLPGFAVFGGSQESVSVNIDLDKCRAVHEFMALCSLNQLNSTRNQNNRLLDLIFSNCDLDIKNCDSPLVKLDNHHPALCCVFDFQNAASEEKLLVRDFRKADYDSLNQILCNIDWMCLFNNNETVSGCLETFYRVLRRVVDEMVPFKRRRKSNFPLWYSDDTIFSINQKRKYHAKWKKHKNDYDYERFSSLRQQCHLNIEADYSSYIRKCEDSIISSPKTFWRYVNDNKQDKNEVPVCVVLADRESGDLQDASEIFADYFESTYSKAAFSPPEVSDFYGVSLSSLDVSYDEVYDALSQLNDDCTSGPDQIPAILLKRCSFSLTFPLTVLFNISLQEGTVPSSWKMSYIIPILKSGSKSEVKNYRPICKNSFIPQVLDSIITNKLTAVFEKFIAVQQHGFCSNKGALTNLIPQTETAHDAFEERCQLDAIYTDFQKAFDSVLVRALVFKLECSGVHGSLLRWLESYLSNRFQVVKLKNCYSRTFEASSGVPQGSHLGPLLFLLFINDLSWEIGSGVELGIFADDLKIYKKVSTSQDARCLQESLNLLSTYCDKFHLKLNTQKCFHITFSRKTLLHLNTQFTLKGEVLTRVDTIKDLGILLDSKLTYNAHINFIYNKALKMLGFLFRVCKDFRNLHSLKTVYFSYVRSHLEYCCQIWNPSHNHHEILLEKIQRKFVRFLFFKNLVPDNVPNPHNRITHDYSYTSCLDSLNMRPLAQRRRFFDADLIVKAFTNQINSTGFMGFIRFPPSHHNLRKCNTFLTSATKHSTLNRCMVNFNNLNVNLDEIKQLSYRQAKQILQIQIYN